MGATDDWIKRQVRAGRLIRMRRGVLRTAGAPVTQEQAWLAAVLEVGDGAVLSHASAAAAWRLRGVEPPSAIDVMAAGRQPRTPGVRGHRTLWLPARDRTTHRRIPITSAERTLIDASARISPWVLGRIVDDALRRRLVTLPHLVRCFNAVPVSGRRPSRAMKDVLAERVPGFVPGGSASELDVLAVLRAAGIDPLPVQQHRVRIEGHTYVFDYAWPASRHVIEYQGDPHEYVSAMHDDLERWRRVQRAGWTLWACTSHTTRDEYVAIGLAATA